MSYIAELPYVGWVIPFLLVLGVVIFIHEYGHYIVGRWSGIGADVFSIGFGPVLWSRTDKRGTRWQIAAIRMILFVELFPIYSFLSCFILSTFSGTTLG